MCLPGVNRGVQVDVEPLLDRLIIFDSEMVEHEVLPAHHDRYAITCWMYSGDEEKEEEEKRMSSKWDASTIFVSIGKGRACI
jgi:hypothetical protein